MAEIVKHVVEESSFFSSKEMTSIEYARLADWIKETIPEVKITRIEKIPNEHLYAAFKIRQCEMGSNCAVEEVLHATYASCLPLIINNNLDWRFVTRTKYGTGISFSKNADYANFYSNRFKCSELDKVFVVCDLLTKDKCTVMYNNTDAYPVHPYDTYVSDDEHVYVKFDDFTYWPKYAIHYVKPEPASSSFHKSRRNKMRLSWDHYDYAIQLFDNVVRMAWQSLGTDDPVSYWSRWRTELITQQIYPHWRQPLGTTDDPVSYWPQWRTAFPTVQNYPHRYG